MSIKTLKTEFRYRFVETIRFTGVADTELFTSSDSHVCLDMLSYPVLRHTQKCVWIRCGLQDKFVLDTARKAFAYPTYALALESFKARKARQVKLLEAQLKKARGALKLAEDFKLPENLELAENLKEDIHETTSRIQLLSSPL